jgi:hypothetical protein
VLVRDSRRTGQLQSARITSSNQVRIVTTLIIGRRSLQIEMRPVDTPTNELSPALIFLVRRFVIRHIIHHLSLRRLLIILRVHFWGVHPPVLFELSVVNHKLARISELQFADHNSTIGLIEHMLNITIQLR